MKAKVEWQPEPGKWISQEVDLLASRKGNTYFKKSGIVYVITDMKQGSPVISKDSQGRWVNVGTVVHGSVFLGDGISYSEYCATPGRPEKRSRNADRNSKMDGEHTWLKLKPSKGSPERTYRSAKS